MSDLQPWARDQMINVILERFGEDLTWEIVKTATDKSIKSTDWIKWQLRSTFEMQVTDAQGKLFMKSDPMQGYHKAGWSGSDWGMFIKTLKEV